MKTLLFVDDEPKVLQGLQRLLRPMRNEWEMNFVGSGSQALDFMAARHVDVIVSDMIMPIMDGSQLLNEISRRHPDTVRIVLSGHAEREAVLRLVGPAHQYLSKPCNADELRDAVIRAFALRDILGSDQLKALATRVKDLPTLPTYYQQLTEELQKEDPSIERVGEIISRDIGMAAKILQLVNSAFFGLPQSVHSPVEAVMYLGLITVRSLVLSVHIFSQFDQNACKSFSLDALARHSWHTGVAARNLARLERRDAKTQEQCFLVGLLHDTGQLILAAGLPDEYEAALQTARKQNRPMWQVEKEYFGASHADIGAYLLALWGMPNPVIEAVAMHHCPAARIDKEFSPVVAVHVADVFLQEGADAQTEFPPPTLDKLHLQDLGLLARVDDWRAACLEPVET